MKKFNSILLTCALIISAIFTSCEESDNDFTLTTLPEFKINGVVDAEIISTPENNTGTITFTAESMWRVNVVQQWIVLDTKTGSAGEQTINYTIVNSVDLDDELEGLISIVFGELDPYEINVTRLAKEHEIIILNGESEAIEFIEVNYNEEGRFYWIGIESVKGNFDWTVTELPAWVKGAGVDVDGLERTYSGDAGVDMKFVINLDTREFLINTPMSANIVFGAEGVEYTKSLEVKFTEEMSESINNDFINLDETLPSVAGLTVDGFALNADIDGTGENVTDQVGYDFDVIAGEAGVGIVSFEAWDWGIKEIWPNSWFRISKVESSTRSGDAKAITSQYTIRVDDNTAGSRFALVYILPASVIEVLGGIDNAAEGMIYMDDLQMDAIKPEYEQYLVSTVTQDAAVIKKEFTIGNDWGGAWDAQLIALEEGASEFTKYGTENVFKLVLGAEANSTIVNTVGYSSDDYIFLNLEQASGDICNLTPGMGYETGGGEGTTFSFTFYWNRNDTDVDKTSVLKFKYAVNNGAEGEVEGENYGVLLITQKPTAAIPE